MTIPFGPQLIGQTEKALGALLHRFLEGSGLDERQWVTLRLADQLQAADAAELASSVSQRAHFPDAAGIVAGLTERGLLADGRLTPAAGEMVTGVQARIDGGEQTPPIWDDLDPDDVEATTRILNLVLDRAQQNLAGGARPGA